MFTLGLYLKLDKKENISTAQDSLIFLFDQDLISFKSTSLNQINIKGINDFEQGKKYS